jgi:hypothetical protein
MEHLQKLIAILKETRAFLTSADSDFSWSSWADQNQALSEIDSIIAELERGVVRDIRVLFAPTGPIQEVSLSSGWGEKFPELAERFDKEYKILKNQS